VFADSIARGAASSTMTGWLAVPCRRFGVPEAAAAAGRLERRPGAIVGDNNTKNRVGGCYIELQNNIGG
jgi:hypothetical protein